MHWLRRHLAGNDGSANNAGNFDRERGWQR
jgi:hypothetical protein